ncbi:neurotrimin-like isoform X3 [Asterias rubens]|uniref:neurotrimin-like isoform X3 n=1 Tax=Asterias rubens TaxID=7604 RepID=UPI0014554090|nr:neurotrimin-like isoform X3 [Asterias rubens]
MDTSRIAMFLFGTILWTANIVPIESREVIVIGTTSFPAGKRSEKCVKKLTNSEAKPGKFMNKCISASTTLLVPGSPTVETSGPALISKHEGDEVVLSCTVTNRGSGTIVSWLRIRPRTMTFFFNSQRVHMDKRFRIETDSNTTYNLRITRITRDDEGVYACQVNTLPAPTYINITLQVVVAPTILGIAQEFGSTPPSIDNAVLSYNESDNVILSCETDGSPKPFVTWYSFTARQVISYNSTLKILNVQRDQGGLFKCVADNGYAETLVEKWIEIIVQYKPEIIAVERDIRCGEGDYRQLQCNVNARPQATNTWIKDDEILKGVGITKRSMTTVPVECPGNTTRLVIVSVQPDTDYGVYKCQATNILGTTEDVIEVSGRLRAPKIVSGPVGVRRHSYKLQWVVGNRLQQGMAGFTPIDDYILSYYGWWYQEREDGGTEKVFSHSRDSPLEVAIPHDPDLSRQVYILRDLRANVTYEVTLKGVNKYGDGDNASFTFYTSLVNSWETTPYPVTRKTVKPQRSLRWANAGPALFTVFRQTSILTASILLTIVLM